MRFLPQSLVSRSFFVRLRYSFQKFFLSFPFVSWCPFPIFPDTCRLHLIILLIGEFFPPALADSFPLELEWQQVSSSLQDSSWLSGRSQQYCSLDGLHSSSYFQIHQSQYQTFSDCTEQSIYNWYHCHFHVPKFFSSQPKFKYLSFFSLYPSVLTRKSAGVAYISLKVSLFSSCIGLLVLDFACLPLEMSMQFFFPFLFSVFFVVDACVICIVSG